MNAPGLAAVPSPPLEEGAAATLPSSLAALRSAGAERFDPVRFRYLEALSQRLAAQSGAVQRILEGKLQAALADYAVAFRRAQEAAGDLRAVRRPGAKAAASRPGPLGELNRYIHTATQGDDDGAFSSGAASAMANGSGARPELKSVQRFREVWSRLAAVDQVDDAIERGPENAGPLNSHMLVLRSLALMRALSPDYLRRFLSHVDALLWLDQAGQKQAPAEVKPARRSRQKK